MKEVLKSVFDNDYQGYPVFIDNVLRPIFGDDMEVLRVKEELDIDRETLQKASIKELCRVATIDRIGVDTIEVFDVTLDDKTIISRSRVGIQRIIRSALFQYTHAFMLFHYENPKGRNWRFSYAYKQDKNSTTTEAKRYTYLFGQNLHCRTAIDRFCTLAKSSKDNKALLDAFSVEALSDEFFDTYKKQYTKFVKYITGKEFVKEGNKWVEKQTGEANDVIFKEFSHEDKRVRDYIKKMMGRITFLHFLQRKRWMNGDLNYMLHLFQNSDKQDSYLENVLEPLFFGILNTKEEDREQLFIAKGWDKSLLDEWRKIPYLNGGLFEEDEEDNVSVTFPKEYFAELFEFYSEYNFTVDENDPDDAEVGVDPEMLGKIFENLLEDNKDKGAFYTPKEIVRYMCQESLIAYLVGKSGIEEQKIRDFVTLPYDTVDRFNEKELEDLLTYLDNVKICDPAIGSGAFPMGLLNELVRCEEAIVLGQEKNTARAELKKSIIKENIYGVDIEKGAVDIARLRFWLSLVVDEEEPMPLPNLDYKIMQGNSLLESYNGVDLSHLLDQEDGDLFSSTVIPIQMQLESRIGEYYTCGDHRRKVELKEEIKDLIVQQLDAKSIAIDLSGIDVTGNTNFFLWHTWFSDVFKRPSDCNGNSGFDIVIGNPPYVEAKKLKYIASTLRCFYSTYSGTADLSIYFIELAFNLLKENGVLCYITTNKFFNTGYGRPVRNLLCNTHINAIINFEQVEVFEGILVSSVVLNVIKANPLSTNSFTYNRFYKLKANEFRQAFIANLDSFGSYSQSYLDDREWSFADIDGLNLKQKIENGSIRLADIAGVKIYRGVTTGYNPAFIINDNQKDILIENDERNRDVIKNMLQGRNIRKWYYNESDENMIFTRKGCNINNYPLIKEHLYAFYNQLKPKTNSTDEEGRKPGNYQWYEILDNTAYYKQFEQQEKIIWGLTSNSWTFAYDDKQHYLPSNGYILTSESLPIKYLLGWLNSKLMHHYFKYIGVMTAGGAYTLKAATISALPIKLASDEEQSAIVDIVDEILRIKESNHNADITSQERRMNEIVYDMYDISEAEKALIETALSVDDR